jgi:hypothetical protein
MTPAGFPHSDIPGSKLVCSSPRLIAAYRVLHRLLVPRHPPCALSSLTGISITKVHRNWLPSVSYSVVKDRSPREAARDRGPEGRASRKIYRSPQRELAGSSLGSGGDSGARTRSLRLAKPALSQLSYIPGAMGPAVRTVGPRSDGGPGWTRTTHLTLIRRAL